MPDEVTKEELVSRIKNGEKELIGELWDRVKQFAYVMAKDMRAGDMTEDLEQECFLALLDAVRNYEETEGTQFLTYATFHFRARMWRYLRHESGGREIPHHMIEKLRKYRRTVADFQREYGREPSGIEIMARCGWTVKELIRIKENLNADKTDSLDAPLSESEDLTLADTVPGGSDPAEEVEDKIFREQLSRDLWAAVDRLPAEQAAVIRSKYQEEKTFQEIEDDLGLTEGDARQLSAKGLRELRSRRNRTRLRPYYIDLFGEGVRGGLHAFFNSGTSSTERAALKLMGAWWENDVEAR